MDGVEGLWAELDVLCGLYERMGHDLRAWPGSPAADRLGSPVALPKVAARKALDQHRPDERRGISRRAKAAELAAHLGGRTEIGIRGVALPMALADGIGAYPAIGELQGTSRFLQAEEIEQRHLRPGHGLEGLRAWLGDLSIDDLLSKPEIWRELAGVALVEPDGDILPVRGRALASGHGLSSEIDETLLAPVAAGSTPVWVGLPDVIASMILTGRGPRILEAYAGRPVGTCSGAKPVTLPGGVVWDPHLKRRRGSRFPTLAAALTEIGLRSKDGTLRGLDPAQQRRVGACAKNARNGIAYGAAVEYNPGDRAHPMWGPSGVVGRTKDQPGELADPVVGMLATSGERLVLAILERLVRDAGGSIMFMDTDSAAIVATPDGSELIPCPGGPHIDEEGRECVLALSFEQVVEILDRFRPLAVSTGLSLPAWRVRRDGDGFGMERTSPAQANLLSLFKVTSECLDGRGRWVRTEAVAVSTKRYVLFRHDDQGCSTSVKPSGHVLGTLANFRPDGAVDWDGVGRVWELGLGRWLGVGQGADPVALGLNLAQPVLQPFAARDPRDFLALGAARFTVDRPDGLRPFEELLVPILIGRGQGRIVAPMETDPSQWERMTYTSSKGRSFVVQTIETMTVGRVRGSSRPREVGVLVARDLGDWLDNYFSRPVSGTLGPDGQPCGPQTRGVLRTRPVRIVRVNMAGTEPHRRRDEEAVLGWDVQVAQDVPGRARVCIGCGGTIEGRARRWCPKCRRSGHRRATSKLPSIVRSCGCGCGTKFEPGAKADKLYLSDAHKHRAYRRARKAAA